MFRSAQPLRFGERVIVAPIVLMIPVWISIEPVCRPIALDYFDNRIAETKRWPTELPCYHF